MAVGSSGLLALWCFAAVLAIGGALLLAAIDPTRTAPNPVAGVVMTLLCVAASVSAHGLERRTAWAYRWSLGTSVLSATVGAAMMLSSGIVHGGLLGLALTLALFAVGARNAFGWRSA